MKLAASLALYFGSQILSGEKRRRLLARAHRLDPSGALPLIDLARRGSLADAGLETRALLSQIAPQGSANGYDLEDVLLARLLARIDPQRHPRAHLAQRFAAYLERAPRSVSPSQLAQDLFVTFMLGDLRGTGYFVEFGAHDGVELSNTYRLERDLGWSGIVAEPNPSQHEALRRNRRCTISPKCVWTKTGERLTFSVVDAAPALSTLETFQAGDMHDRKGARSIEVETISLNDMLREHGAPRRIDYMSIDTEGSELAILEAFDFGAHDVSVFTIEHNFGAGRSAIHSLLASRGYVRVLEVFSRWDDWYVRKDVAERLMAGAPAT
jgi:FkbM family methyltransferase